MKPSFVFCSRLVKGPRAKQLHLTATRSWVYNNDKRIEPSGRKHFTLWRWRIGGGGGGRRRGDFLVDEHKVHGPFRQMGRNNKVHKRHSCNRKTVVWNINGIYLQTSYCNQQLSSGTWGRGKERARKLVLDWQPLGAEVHAHELHTQTQKHTHTHTLVKLRLDRGAWTTPLIPPGDTERSVSEYSENRRNMRKHCRGCGRSLVAVPFFFLGVKTWT